MISIVLSEVLTSVALVPLTLDLILKTLCNRKILNDSFIATTISITDFAAITAITIVVAVLKLGYCQTSNLSRP